MIKIYLISPLFINNKLEPDFKLKPNFSISLLVVNVLRYKTIVILLTPVNVSQWTDLH